jgi:predicted transcriptional regulator
MPDLNNTQLEVLRILWKLGPLKPAEIEEHFSWPIENATLRSVLRKLCETDHVRREKQGRAYVYCAATTHRAMLTRMVRRMAKIFSGGSHAAFISQLIECEELSPDEIAELRRIANSRIESPRPRRQRKRRS